MPKSRGFTLVELLITIMIIGVLAAIGFFTYSSVLKQGRDSKRQADLRAIQSALEQYYSDQGFYPKYNATQEPAGLGEAIGYSPPVAFTNLIGFPCTISGGDCPSVKTYINSLPQDPLATTPYAYMALPIGCTNSGIAKCTNYCLYAKLENSDPGKPAVCNIAGFAEDYNFALTPP